MHRTNSKSYYWLLLASFVTVAACGGDDDGGGGEPPDMEPEPTVDAGGGGADGGMTQPDASTPRPDGGSTTVDSGTGTQPDSGGNEPTPDAGGQTDSGTLEPVGPSAANGEMLADLLGCISCHRPNYAGAAMYPNITSDVATGIGSWTIAELANAIANGVGKDGAPLCATMPRYGMANDYGDTISQAEAEDIGAFLKAIPAINKVNNGTCN